MSGHSKWSTIKRKKEITDSKKGKIFTKMANLIAIAAREGGGDLNANFKLRLAVDKARSCNVPAGNIERAIKKGTGALPGVVLEQIQYEIYGPSGAALIVEAVTDNKNRTVSELRKVLTDNSGRLAEKGSVAYLFERKGVISLLLSENKPKSSDDLILLAIDCGAEDVQISGDNLLVYVKTHNLRVIKDCLEKRGIKIVEVGIELAAKNKINIEDNNSVKEIEKLMEEIDDLDDVTEIYSNIKVS